MRAFRAYCLTALALAAASCSTSHMDVVEERRITAPPPGKALIYFVREEAFGYGEAAVVFDDRRYLGTLNESRHIAYVAEPGLHLFMVVSEAADFMEAELEPDKIYYAGIRIRVGVWKGRFSFVPHNTPAAVEKAQATVARTPQVTPNRQGIDWVERRRTHIERMREKFYRVWVSRRDRQTLPASAGVAP